MSKLIELDEAMEILKNWEAITYNCNTIEESFAMLANEVNSLPQIDIVGEIKKMIEINRDEVYMEGKETSRTSIEYEILQELLQKFKS